MNLEESAYLSLLNSVLNTGHRKPIFSDNGSTLPTVDKNQWKEVDKDSKYIISSVGAILRFSLRDNSIPIYTTKRVYYQGAFKEMLWFLKGSGDVAKLHQEGVPIWNGWAYKDYLKCRCLVSDEPEDKQPLSFEAFVKKYLEEKNEYVIQVPYTDMTGWGVSEWEDIDDEIYPDYVILDQTKWLIDAIKKNPERKSYLVSAWNPARLYGMAGLTNTEPVVLAACHSFHQVLVNDNKLSLVVYIRSNDLGLGNPFNVAQYGLLAHMYAKCTGFEPHELVVMIGDAHIYSDQVESIKEQITRTPKDFPTLKIADRGQQYLTDFVYEDFIVEGYESDSTVRMPLTVVGGF